MITALQQVFESVGDGTSFRDGSLVGSPEAIERFVAGTKTGPRKESFVTYVDRQGNLHLPYEEAFEFVRKFFAAEPSTVLVEVEAFERKWSHKAHMPCALAKLQFARHRSFSFELLRTDPSTDDQTDNQRARQDVNIFHYLKTSKGILRGLWINMQRIYNVSRNAVLFISLGIYSRNLGTFYFVEEA